MSNILLAHVIFAGLYLTPVVLTYNSCYLCASGPIREEKGKIWISKGESFQDASSKAIDLCKMNAKKSEECGVLNCKRKFLCD